MPKIEMQKVIEDTSTTTPYAVQLVRQKQVLGS